MSKIKLFSFKKRSNRRKNKLNLILIIWLSISIIILFGIFIFGNSLERKTTGFSMSVSPVSDIQYTTTKTKEGYILHISGFTNDSNGIDINVLGYNKHIPVVDRAINFNETIHISTKNIIVEYKDIY